ncbi:antitoxin Xre/MbcA/ParS toxin-binding domain-containing protein [Paraburkholderia sp. GAS82]|jgi:putative toxin-antitoxin system antitoxin component (TIGR02293 family)|uniref:antitoxin Xre/MbcA/ParS toxin-binding domain-containing protein n=1 Tax=Paraburkholderia sp. GAS82 TaxID=3035137 RepID=UPI003D19E2F1
MPTVSFKPSGNFKPREAEFELLGKLLDEQIHSDSDLAKLARERVPTCVIDRLSNFGLEARELSFIIHGRMLTRRRQRHERLSIDESDKAIRLAKILALTTTCFGNREKAIRWLRRAQRRFGGRSALEFLGSEHGARLVEESIAQIDEGYFA